LRNGLDSPLNGVNGDPHELLCARMGVCLGIFQLDIIDSNRRLSWIVRNSYLASADVVTDET
jgi:hypothetical protein